MEQCNICGNREFAAGPGGRMSSTGKPPTCTNCFSLERHRSYRKAMLLLQESGLLNVNAIQFSEDRSVDPSWFAQYELSVYGGSNSVDIQKIDRETGSYGLAICNHVLEHVPYDNAAINELLRIVDLNGFLFLAVPAPLQNARTRDWGYADERDHGHYRIYGSDIEDFFRRFLSGKFAGYADFDDPATGMPERVYFICHKAETISNIAEAIASNSELKYIKLD